MRHKTSKVRLDFFSFMKMKFGFLIILGQALTGLDVLLYLIFLVFRLPTLLQDDSSFPVPFFIIIISIPYFGILAVEYYGLKDKNTRSIVICGGFRCFQTLVTAAALIDFLLIYPKIQSDLHGHIYGAKNTEDLGGFRYVFFQKKKKSSPQWLGT